MILFIRFCDISNCFLFLFYFLFREIITSNLWYHKIEFAISKNSILWYKHQHAFIVSWWFCDITDLIFNIISSIFWYQKFDILEITKYCSYYFQILQNVFSDITKNNFWYHKSCDNKKSNYFVIPLIQYCDIKQLWDITKPGFLWYNPIDFVISEIKKWNCDITK